LALPGTEPFVSLANGFTAGLHILIVGDSIWSTVNLGPGTSLFTGVPLVSNLKITVKNKNGFIQSAYTTINVIGGNQAIAGVMGGNLRLNGQSVVFAAAGFIQLPVPLNQVGNNFGNTTMATLLGNNITATNGPFLTGPLKITGISSNFISIPGRGGAQGVGFTLQPTPDETGTNMTFTTLGGFRTENGAGIPIQLTMVTISGTNNLLSASKPGTITVIAPLRVFTGAIAGNLPGEVTLSFTFVPEPGTMLLLVSGAVGLAVIGRRRMRK
jgi:hypothetical protein